MKSWLRALSLKNLKTEISGYGYHYSLKNFFLLLLLLVGLIIAAGYFFMLDGRAILAICITALLCLPFLVRSQYKYLYEQQRFSDLILYMEGVIFSFKRKPKIYDALKEVLPTLHEDTMQKDIAQAIEAIEDARPLDKALKVLNEHYACQRLKHLHSFLVSVEQIGGKYQDTLNVLLEDIHEWTQRTYRYQQDRKQLRLKLYACLVMSLLICWGSVYMAQAVTSGIFNTPVYQIVTASLLILFLIFYTISESRISADWLSLDSKNNRKETEKILQYLTEKNPNAVKKKARIISFILCVPSLYLFYIRKTSFGIALLIFVFTYYQTESSKYKKRKKRMQELIEKEYPDWLRALGLQLQTNNVYVSIRNTVPDAPLILKKPLQQLAEQIENHPDSLQPYQQFLSDFDLPEIKRSVKMIASLNNLGTSEANDQINKIIEQNMRLSGKADDLKNQDQITMLGMLGTVPMVLSSVKLVVDLFLILADFLTITRLG